MNGIALGSAVGLNRIALRSAFILAVLLGGGSASMAQTEPPLPTVQFSSSSYNVNESAGTQTITVTLSPASAGVVSVDYATSDGTATAPSDYTSACGTLTFAAGETSKTFTVSIVDDSITEPDEDINLTLSNPVNATLGSLFDDVLNILDDDVPPPIVQFSATSFAVAENAGVAVVTVNLYGASSQNVTVDYATSDGTATAPSDYTSTSGTLTFAPGETSKTFSVTIVDDALPESDETIGLTLSNPANATLGTVSTATLEIFDDDSPTAYSVTVNVTTEDLGPVAVSQESQAALTAEANLAIGGSQPTDPINGPSWAWQVSTVEYSSDGITYVPTPGGDHVQITQLDSAVADATLVATFDTQGYWKITVNATASYFDGATEIASGDADGAVQACAAAVTYDVRSTGAIALVSQPATAAKLGWGTSPPDGALVSPGQNVLWQLQMTDSDQYRITGSGAAGWKDFAPTTDWPGSYGVKLTLTNAKFTDSGLGTRAVNATRKNGGGIFLYAVPITIATPWAGDVKIDIEVTDSITIPNTFPLGPMGAATDCQDPKWTGTITWKKATVFPTTQAADKQDPGAIGTMQTTVRMQTWYLYGPDLNGAGNTTPNYQFVTVDEKFAALTSNLKTAWVNQAVRLKNPAWGDADWVKYFFVGSGINGSFMIGIDDHTTDTNGGNILAWLGSAANLSPAGAQATLYADMPQTFEVPPGKTVGRYTVRYQRTGARDGSAIYQIRKQ